MKPGTGVLGAGAQRGYTNEQMDVWWCGPAVKPCLGITSDLLVYLGCFSLLAFPWLLITLTLLDLDNWGKISSQKKKLHGFVHAHLQLLLMVWPETSFLSHVANPLTFNTGGGGSSFHSQCCNFRWFYARRETESQHLGKTQTNNSSGFFLSGIFILVLTTPACLLSDLGQSLGSFPYLHERNHHYMALLHCTTRFRKSQALPCKTFLFRNTPQTTRASHSKLRVFTTISQDITMAR